MTNSSRNKLFLCFRPVVDIDVMLDSTVPVSHSKPPSMPPKRNLSRLIKSMVSQTILNRRARRKNGFPQDSCGSKRSCSAYTEETSSTGDDRSICSQSSVDTSSIPEINPVSQVSTCSSESEFLCKSKSYPSEAKHRKRSARDPLEKKRKRMKLAFSGIYLLLLSLTLTVFWGKILGIFLTSIWLYSYSFLRARYLRSDPKQSLERATRIGVITREGYNKRHLI